MMSNDHSSMPTLPRGHLYQCARPGEDNFFSLFI